jgi:hypothetical protein
MTSRGSFEEFVDTLYSVNLNVDKTNAAWHDSLYIANYRKFFHFLTGAESLLENDNTEIDLQDVRRLLDMLTSMATTATKFLLTNPERYEDEYADCPLTQLYLGVATCVLYLRDHSKENPERYSNKKQGEIPFCIHNSLCVVAGRPIKEYNLEELIAAMNIMERKAHGLKFTKDMYEYLDALEERVSEMILHANPVEIFNIATHHLHYEDDLYTCTTNAEFQLIVNIVSLRRIANSALLKLREDAITYNDLEDDSVEQIEAAVDCLKNAMINKCRRLHTDEVADDFSEQYKKNAITLSEAYFFYKMNTPDTRINCATIVKTYRNLAHWRTVTEAAYKELLEYVEDDPDQNLMAFQIIFKILLNLLVQQTVGIAFLRFWLEGDTIYHMDEEEYEHFLRESSTTPFFVRSFSDACIFYSGKLYIFGASSKDYYRALAHWIILINTRCGGMITTTNSIEPLVDFLCSEEFNPTPTPQEDIQEASSSVFSDFMSRAERERARAFNLFKRVELNLLGAHQTMDDSNSVGDIEATGLPASSRSGWSRK